MLPGGKGPFMQMVENPKGHTPNALPRHAPGCLVIAGLLIGMCGWSAALVRAQTAAGPAPSVAKSSSLLKVFGDDERERVTDTTQLPWSAIGWVQSVWYQDGFMSLVTTGTGVLIGNSVVLTAGHCIYDQEHGWADRVVFVPGKSGDTEPFGRSSAVRNISQRAWVDEGDNRYDVAMIVLEQALGEQAGHITVGIEPDSFFVNRNLNTAGYPGELFPGDVQYHSFGTSMDVQDGLLRHELDSEHGQSGSPIWYYDPEGDSRRIVGVLTGSRDLTSNGEVIDSYNVGIHLDTTFGEWINETLAKYDTVGESVDLDATDPVADSSAAPCGIGVPATAAVGLMLMAFLGTVRRHHR